MSYRNRLFLVLLCLVSIGGYWGCSKPGRAPIDADKNKTQRQKKDDRQKEDESECRLRRKVSYHTLCDRDEGEVLVTHFDPMFVLVINVESPPTDSRIKKGLNAFAIHSPTQVFAMCKVPEPNNDGSDDSKSVLRPEIKGMRFSFPKKDRNRLWWLEAKDIH